MSLALYFSRVRSNDLLGRAPLFDNGKHKRANTMVQCNEVGLLHPRDSHNSLVLNGIGTVQEFA
jgi:hypothetical protein